MDIRKPPGSVYNFKVNDLTLPGVDGFYVLLRSLKVYDVSCGIKRFSEKLCSFTQKPYPLVLDSALGDVIRLPIKMRSKEYYVMHNQ